VFVARLNELGGKVLVDEKFASTAKDIRAQVTKAVGSKPDAIYFVPQTPSNAILGLTQIRQQGYKGQILSNEFINAEEVLKAAKSAAEGAIYAEPLFDPNRTESKAFLDKFKAKYGGVLPGGVPPVYFATAYDAVYVITDQIKKNGLDTDKIKAGLYAVKDWAGSAGVLTIDSNGDPVFEYVTKQIKDGKGIEVK
jgi:ABC-type branched-subunit amino acid transport system substrate-binding protein